MRSVNRTLDQKVVYTAHMISALINGTVGLAALLGIGVRILDLSISDLLLAAVISNLGAFLSLIATLMAEKSVFFKRYLNRSLKTWTLLISLYLGILLSFVPILRDFRTLAFLVLPLVLSAGFAIIAFGPVQDQIVRREQRRVR